MTEAKALKAGDPCPNCGGELYADPRFDPEAAIDRNTRNAQSPPAAEKYARAVREKAADEGVIHSCRSCAYQARLKASKPELEPEREAAAAGRGKK